MQTRFDDVPSDAELINRLKASDPSALHAVYQLYRNDLLSAAGATLGRRAAADTWDILHDVFVSFARVSPTLPPGSNLRAYLVRSAVNRARDLLRRRAREPSQTNVDLPTPDQPDGLEDQEQAAELWQAVQSLPPSQRIVVSLRVWGGLTFAEIAEQEQIPENTAQARWRYAVKKLQRRLSQGVQP